MRIVMEGTPKEFRQFFGGDVGLLPGIEDATLATEYRDGGEGGDALGGVAHDLSLVTPLARKALRFIAEHAPTVPFDLVAEHLAVSTRELSGSMSSFGRSAPSVRTLYRSDYNRREYQIEPEAASLILDAMELSKSSDGQPGQDGGVGHDKS